MLKRRDQRGIFASHYGFGVVPLHIESNGLFPAPGDINHDQVLSLFQVIMKAGNFVIFPGNSGKTSAPGTEQCKNTGSQNKNGERHTKRDPELNQNGKHQANSTAKNGSDFAEVNNIILLKDMAAMNLPMIKTCFVTAKNMNVPVINALVVQVPGNTADAIQ